jgi:hypothetical protein
MWLTKGANKVYKIQPAGKRLLVAIPSSVAAMLGRRLPLGRTGLPTF